MSFIIRFSDDRPRIKYFLEILSAVKGNVISSIENYLALSKYNFKFLFFRQLFIAQKRGGFYERKEYTDLMEMHILELLKLPPEEKNETKEMQVVGGSNSTDEGMNKINIGGIDGITKEEYRRNLEENINTLIEDLKKKSYKPKTARLVEMAISKKREQYDRLTAELEELHKKQKAIQSEELLKAIERSSKS